MNLSRRNLLLSVCLHGGLVLVLWLVAKPHTLPEPPPVMQAMLMPAGGAVLPAPQPALPADAPAPAPLPEPEPLPPPPEPAPPKPVTPPTPAPEPAKPAVKPPAKPETVKPAEKKPEKQPPKPRNEPRIDPDAVDSELAEVEKETQRIAREQAEQRKRDALARQQALAAQAADEAEALAAQAAADARARQMAAQIGEFTRAIDRKIKSVWRLPANVPAGLTTEMRITLLPGGEVASVVVIRSSGNPALDASAQEAVRRASPLPVPSDPALFREQFKVLTLKLKSEE